MLYMLHWTYILGKITNVKCNSAPFFASNVKSNARQWQNMFLIYLIVNISGRITYDVSVNECIYMYIYIYVSRSFEKI